MTLAGAGVLPLGRLGWPRRRLARALEAAGARRAESFAEADLVVVAARALKAWCGGRLDERLARAEALGLPLLSEREFLRALGLLPPLPEGARDFDLVRLAELAGLKVETARALALFDVIEGQAGRFGFRELKAAREVKRLLESGAELTEIVRAVASLRRHLDLEAPLAQSVLTLDHGALALSLGERLAETTGQLRLELGAGEPDLESLFAAAEAAEAAGEAADAERFYLRCLAIAPGDALTAFNLGNLLAAEGRIAEAKILWRRAAASDPWLADAWYNLALLLENEERPEEARRAYEAALAADPGFAEAHYNLAMLAIEAARPEDALAPLKRALELGAGGEELARRALRALRLCELLLRRG